MTARQRHQELLGRYAMIDDPQERLTAIVDRARRRPPLAASERTELNRVHGCGTRAWLLGECRNGRCHFRADAESPVVRGLLVLLCELYDGVAPAEVAATEPTVFEDLGLTKTLSPTRLNGLRLVRDRIRAFAHRQLPPAGP